MKFLVADDHPLVRRALALTLEKVSPDVTLLQADSLQAALDVVGQHPDIDLVLMDLSMPDTSGLDGVKEMLRVAAPAPVAVVSAEESPDIALQVLALGGAGYLPKSLPEDVMRAALSLVLAGGTYVPPLVTSRATAPAVATSIPGLMPRGGAADSGTRSSRGVHSLTPRQRDVLDLIIEGMSNKEIADRLQVAEATIKVHVTAILRAFGVNSRAKAISAARREVEAAS
ncbi:response regulator [Novispirillum itersonii]|uniref:DNA-binding NarL/FixJ family response regulator n=1 Tax=Novispirillum itersonii TaxID=189 RepID=A0A7X0DK60_NOVIT|nr:response regulator transcription factor [Novispirillum itersonii]MBB6208636.1 DNA-binding NarL/FixJ family response regulator [Novispirillum itersonii]